MQYTAHKYQAFAIEKIIHTPKCGLFLDMGLGKTVITLTAINELIYNRFAVSRVLIIAPKRVAETTWTDEAAKWDHLAHLRISRVLGTAARRLSALSEDADIYIINRENVTWLTEHCRPWLFDMVVVDELSNFKAANTKRFRALRAVMPKVPRFVGLTGTPAPNGYPDLWSQVYLMDRGERLGRTLTAFRQEFLYPTAYINNQALGYKLRPGMKEVIDEKLKDICVSMAAKDYLDMPELTINDIRVRLDEKELDAYTSMEKDHLATLDGEDVPALSAASVANKLLQMANGRVYDENREVHDMHRRKLDALREIIEESNGQPLLVFYNFKHDLDALLKEFKDCHPRRLDTPQDKKDWDEGKIPLLFAQPASVGHGLNLQKGGHIIVWYGLTWSLELYQQANARLYRQGQTRGVIIHRIISAKTIDETVVERLENKESTQESLLEALRARLKEVRRNGR